MKKSKKGVKGKKDKVRSAAPVVMTVDELIAKGNDALANCQPEIAVEFFSSALKISPEDTSIIDSLAETFIQLGQSVDALELFKRSLAINPEESPYRWLCIAQLQSGEESLLSYQSAIKLFLRILEDIKNKSSEDKKV
jgi:tetratricopeptide (TPR) repeat protein